MIIRPLEPERDLQGYLRVVHQQDPFPRSPDEWWERQRLAGQDAFRRYLVGEADGAVVAIGAVLDQELSDAVSVWLVVDVAHRGRGHGRAMAAALDELIAERAPVHVDARVGDGDRSSRVWAERRGFRLHGHTVRSRLDLSGFGAAAHRGALERAEASGVRFEPAADMDRLYVLFARLAADTPHQDGPPDRRFFRRQVDERPGAIRLIARVAREWVGLAIVVPQGPDGAWNEFTGVLPERRGAGIATALKVLVTEAVRRQGRNWIETINHADNVAMLAVNRALGFRPVAGTLFLRRSGSMGR